MAQLCLGCCSCSLSILAHITQHLSSCSTKSWTTPAAGEASSGRWMKQSRHLQPTVPLVGIHIRALSALETCPVFRGGRFSKCWLQKTVSSWLSWAQKT